MLLPECKTSQRDKLLRGLTNSLKDMRMHKNNRTMISNLIEGLIADVPTNEEVSSLIHTPNSELLNLFPREF